MTTGIITIMMMAPISENMSICFVLYPELLKDVLSYYQSGILTVFYTRFTQILDIVAIIPRSPIVTVPKS